MLILKVSRNPFGSEPNVGKFPLDSLGFNIRFNMSKGDILQCAESDIMVFTGVHLEDEKIY